MSVTSYWRSSDGASGVPVHELVVQRVCQGGGLTNTVFLSSDELPRRTAVGSIEVEGAWSNVFHLPVRGSNSRLIAAPRHSSK